MLQGTLRLTALFAATVILPAILLAYLALSSLRAEELGVEADITRRSSTVAAQVQRDLEASLERFEQTAVQRLLSERSVTSNLPDLSPFLLVVFRIDGDGTLVAPFKLPQGTPEVEPSAFYRANLAHAGRRERGGAYDDAITGYLTAHAAATSQQQAGEASYARARSLWRAGRVSEAELALADVFADFAQVRDNRGFRLGDLATLVMAEIALSREPEIGHVVLRDIVERLLAEQWTIGRAAEPAVARRALRMLEPRGDPEWIRDARSRVAERSTQLYWAERLVGDLGRIAGASTEDQRGFRYYPRPESGALWATLWWSGDLYAFTFDYDDIVDALAESAAAAGSIDAEISATVGRPDRAHALVTRPLSPWLPNLAVSVGPIDPQLITARKRQARRLRLLIIFVAVSMTAFGVVLAAALVGQELSSARMKADFAANVSHELRSPITQIRLKAESLQLDLVRDDHDRRRHYDAIVRESERLSRLVDNVLDFAAIERGAKKYTYRPEDVGQVIRDSVNSARQPLEKRGIEQIELDIPDSLPVIWVDREAVSQILTNLLSNAAKYGGEGKWIGISARESLDGVDVAVKDRGAGIAPADLTRIFDRFYRSSDPGVRRRRGTGIGLTIVRYIVEAHGGTITVDSTVGQGTTFTISFPFQPPPTGQA